MLQQFRSVSVLIWQHMATVLPPDRCAGRYYDYIKRLGICLSQSASQILPKTIFFRLLRNSECGPALEIDPPSAPNRDPPQSLVPSCSYHIFARWGSLERRCRVKWQLYLHRSFLQDQHGKQKNPACTLTSLLAISLPTKMTGTLFST